jgi:hypothetical protein
MADRVAEIRARLAPDFDTAWATTGCQYGPEALGQVRFGWQLRADASATTFIDAFAATGRLWDEDSRENAAVGWDLRANADLEWACGEIERLTRELGDARARGALLEHAQGAALTLIEALFADARYFCGHSGNGIEGCDGAVCRALASEIQQGLELERGE